MYSVRVFSALCAACMIWIVSGDVLRFQSKFEDKHITPTTKSGGVHWALIVAGSASWYNYRHQADACHAYHIMRDHGIPEERIILMMYDDIANNAQNPTPGIIINHPDGDDVYKGVVIDYKGKDVTPENFLAALSGKAELLRGVGSGKVIKSGPNDHIFVNFVDHGAPGILAFPTDELYAKDLMKTITSMHENKQYGQMVFYIEACESGSMFEGLLPENINVYATTAANAKESSYACYYDAKRDTYLGDVYSVMWMEDSDKEDLEKETLHEQYQIVKKETNTSHVMEYGDKKIAEEVCGEFQGNVGVENRQRKSLPRVPFDAVPSEDVPLAILTRRLSSGVNGPEEIATRKELNELLQTRTDILNTVNRIVELSSRNERQNDRILKSRYRLTNFDCYEPVAELFDERCYDISQHEYAARRLYLLVNLCEEQVPVEKILDSIARVCKA